MKTINLEKTSGNGRFLGIFMKL